MFWTYPPFKLNGLRTTGPKTLPMFDHLVSDLFLRQFRWKSRKIMLECYLQQTTTFKKSSIEYYILDEHSWIFFQAAQTNANFILIDQAINVISLDCFSFVSTWKLESRKSCDPNIYLSETVFVIVQDLVTLRSRRSGLGTREGSFA